MHVFECTSMIHNTSVFHGDVQLPVLVNALTRCNMHPYARAVAAAAATTDAFDDAGRPIRRPDRDACH